MTARGGGDGRDGGRAQECGAVAAWRRSVGMHMVADLINGGGAECGCHPYMTQVVDGTWVVCSSLEDGLG